MTEASGRQIDLPWGPAGMLTLDVPPGADVVWPRLGDALGDYAAALGQVLDEPQDGPPLEAGLRAGSTVAIVVDDASRWTPVREALPILLGRIHGAGCRVEDVTISVGVGRHHAVDAAAMARRVGEEVAARYRCFSPPVDDLGAYAELGTTPEGVPVRVFRPVAEADLRILIGSVLPHLQAGFGGGYKLIFPGTSHRGTLGALHRQGLAGDADAGRLLGGNAASNPMRRAIHAAARLVGPCFSVSHLIGGPGQILRVLAGPAGGGSGPAGSRGPRAVPGPRRGPGGYRGRRQPPLAGRPDAELQGAAAPPRRQQAGGRPGRPLLDRP